MLGLDGLRRVCAEACVRTPVSSVGALSNASKKRAGQSPINKSVHSFAAFNFPSARKVHQSRRIREEIKNNSNANAIGELPSADLLDLVCPPGPTAAAFRFSSTGRPRHPSCRGRFAPLRARSSRTNVRTATFVGRFRLALGSTPFRCGLRFAIRSVPSLRSTSARRQPDRSQPRPPCVTRRRESSFSKCRLCSPIPAIAADIPAAACSAEQDNHTKAELRHIER